MISAKHLITPHCCRRFSFRGMTGGRALNIFHKQGSDEVELSHSSTNQRSVYLILSTNQRSVYPQATNRTGRPVLSIFHKSKDLMMVELSHSSTNQRAVYLIWSTNQRSVISLMNQLEVSVYVLLTNKWTKGRAHNMFICLDLRVFLSICISCSFLIDQLLRSIGQFGLVYIIYWPVLYFF